MQAFQDIADANPGPDGHAVAQLGRAGLQGVGGLRREGDEGRRIRRHAPDVQVRLLRVHRDPVLQRVSPTAHDFVLGDGLESGAEPRDARPATLQPAGGIVIPPTATPSSTSGCTAADFSGFGRGGIALIQRGTLQLRREGPERAGSGRHRRHHLQRGQPRPHRPVQSAAWSTPTATRSSRRSRSRSRPFDIGTDLYTSITGAARRRRMNIDIQAIVEPERRRLERHRGVEGRRQEPCPRRRRPPGCDLRRRACSTTPPARRRSWTSPRR